LKKASASKVVEFTTSTFPSVGIYWGIAMGAAAVLALLVRAYLTRARQMRQLEQELRRTRAVAAELQISQIDSEQRTRQRMEALELRNQELVQQRLALLMTNERLRRLVGVDSLTGIANRRHFDRSLEREVRRARREGRPLSLIFLDLDEFKRFNDTYGHPRGDEVLRHVAQTLNETFRRGGDFVARYGGEEFAVVLPDVDARRAALYAERLRRRIWRLAIPYGNSSSADRVTISGGVATIAPRMKVSADQLLRAADKALYRAKCLGRNQIASAAVETVERLEAALAS
jgi:diguanylate cyclase (GGDEF)-like protein